MGRRRKEAFQGSQTAEMQIGIGLRTSPYGLTPEQSLSTASMSQAIRNILYPPMQLTLL